MGLVSETRKKAVEYVQNAWPTNPIDGQTCYYGPDKEGYFYSKEYDIWIKLRGLINLPGTLWTWGYNQYGQLGDGTTTNKSSPIQVGSLNNWSSVDCGYYHTVVIKTDSTLWIWGRNDCGQLGDGSATNKSSPIQVGNLTTWKSVDGGYGHTIAIKLMVLSGPGDIIIKVN